jgi:hypothetical protein
MFPLLFFGKGDSGNGCFALKAQRWRLMFDFGIDRGFFFSFSNTETVSPSSLHKVWGLGKDCHKE